MAYQLVTFDDILDAVVEELKLSPDDTVELARIRRDINIAYQNQVVPAKRWPWLRGNTQIEVRPYLANGTVACTPDSTTITFSTAPTTSKTGYLFAIDSFSEIYQISSHTANSTTATLSSPWTGTVQTAAAYKVWTDTVALPTDCRETIEVWHNFFRQPLEAVGLQELRRRVAEDPKADGRPEIYSTYDYVGSEDSTRYRVMKLYPSVYANSTTLTVDYVKEVSALDLTTDEPKMPVEDRVVLVYGALARAWKRLRNDNAAMMSQQDFDRKLAEMSGRVEDSQDSAQLTPSSPYLARKRGRTVSRSLQSPSSGSGSYTAPSYLKNATIEGANITANVTIASGITVDGVDISTLSSDFSAHLADTVDAHDASAISFTPVGTVSASDVQSAIAEVASEAAALSTLTNAHIFVGNASNVATDVAVTGDIGITNAGVTSISSGVIVDADVNASAAIARTKVASGTASHVVINDGTGVLSSEATLAKSRGGTGADNSSVTFPASGVLVTEAGTQTLTNKTLTTPVISQISNTGTLTLPTSTDTVVGRATTDTLTNKSISGSTNTITNVPLATAVSGTLPVANGGTGQTSYTNGQLLIGNTTGNTLAKATLTAGTGISVTNGAGSITVAASPTAPTIQKFTSGSGTYTTPAGVLYIRVRMAGGGGGSSGSGTSSTMGAGGAGGSTTFGTSLLSANGGSGGDINGGAAVAAAGGSASLGTGPIGVAITGGRGGGGDYSATTNTYLLGGSGGANPFGGASGGTVQNNAYSGAANTGAGASGSGTNAGTNIWAGAGGGAGGYVDAMISSPSSTYSYAVGAGGSAGTAGTSGVAGAAGAAGIIIVEEYYQ